MKLVRITFALLLTFTFQSQAYAKTSTIGIIVFDGFLTSDVTAPVEVFGAASRLSWFSDYDVKLISTTKQKTVSSEEGLRVIANATIYDAMELDVLIVPSSYNMRATIKNKEVIQFIQAQHRKASWMASNCSGAFLLAEAGILDGKKATTWAGGEKDLVKAHPKIDVQYDTNVVVDKGVITSNGGSVSYLAAFALLAELSSEEHSKEVQDKIQFNRLGRAFQ